MGTKEENSNFENVKESFAGKEKLITESLKRLEEAKKQLLEKYMHVKEKNISISGEPAKVALTKGGAVMILFSNIEEAEKYFSNLGT